MSRVYFVDDLTPEQEANARKWIAALRSGDYQQGTGVLGREFVRGIGREYCCLGVAAVVLDEFKTNFVDGWMRACFGGTCDTTALPEKDVVGLVTELGVPREAWADQLALLNDDRRANFNQIADLLEADLAGELTQERYNAILGGDA